MSLPQTKRCTKCERELPLNRFYMTRYRPYQPCKECRILKAQERYAKNWNQCRTRKAKQREALRMAHPDRFRQYNADYYMANKAAILAKQKAAKLWRRPAYRAAYKARWGANIVKHRHWGAKASANARRRLAPHYLMTLVMSAGIPATPENIAAIKTRVILRRASPELAQIRANFIHQSIAQIATERPA